MSLVGLPNLYCTPGDVTFYLSSQGAQLRLDDANRATGQTVQVLANANQGDTSLSVAPLDAPLPAGTVLDFDGGGMSTIVEAVLTVTAPVGSTSLTVVPLPGPVTALAYAFDLGVTVATRAFITQAIQWATAQVKLYCCGRYQDSDLATCWSANRWATTLAAYRLSKRRAQPAPGGIKSDYDETMQELKSVRVGMLNIEDIGTRTSSWPFVSNTTVDIAYHTAKVRVEDTISEGTPTQYAQYVDWSSYLFFEI